MVLAAAAMLLHGPILQPGRYHEFADSRAWLGLPNAADVLSNVGFALAGLWGLLALRGGRHRATAASSWPGYHLFLASLLLTALGSGYYHLAPDNDRLLWDRLPIALACAGLLAAVHAETHDAAQPRWLLPALVAAAVASVLWWSVTDRMGSGDLRPYLLLQGAPLVLIPLWQAIHGSPRADRIAFGAAIALYVLAKVAELNDRAVFEASGVVSGHTIKHLLATAASAVIVFNLIRPPRAVNPAVR
jgi:hypothetical protein